MSNKLRIYLKSKKNRKLSKMRKIKTLNKPRDKWRAIKVSLPLKIWNWKNLKVILATSKINFLHHLQDILKLLLTHLLNHLRSNLLRTLLSYKYLPKTSV
jgi:hypothetical protein